jgi:hypothetical protein
VLIKPEPMDVDIPLRSQLVDHSASSEVFVAITNPPGFRDPDNYGDSSLLVWWLENDEMFGSDSVKGIWMAFFVRLRVLST